MRKLKITLVSILLLTSCHSMHSSMESSENNAAIVTPASLLDSSAEQINIDLANDSSVDQLKDWLENDQPSRAELSCFEGYKNCMDARKVLASYNVPFSLSQADNKHGQVVLVYERIVARDCLDKVDTHGNTQTGCANSSNILHMISNHRQIIQPALSDLPRAADYVNSGNSENN